MRIARVFALSLFTIVALFAGAQPCQAEESNSSWLRVEDPLLARAISRGTRESATFKALLDRIENSDLIVYILRAPATGLAPQGRTQFVVSAGARRFVRVTIRTDQVTRNVIALVGHELQHVAELAGEPGVVDNDSYLELYRRIGYSSCDRLCPCFDTEAAVSTGYAVLSELGRNRTRASQVLADTRIATRTPGTVLTFHPAAEIDE
jgi:hypothetical protein